MDIHVLKNELDKAKQRENLLLKQLVCSLAVIGILAILNIYSFFHQKIIVTPQVLNKPFTISASNVDASYLEQMALTFINARFNVTPQNVDSQQQQILRYTDSSAYNTVNSVLQNEADVIKKDDMSSAFLLDQSPEVDVNHLAVRIKGTFRKWVGDRVLPDITKTYLLVFSYNDGLLKLKDFEETKDEDM